MAGEAFQMIGSTQSSDKLARQSLAALCADLPTALRLGGLRLLVVLHGVGHGAHGGICAVLRGEALRAGRGEGVEGVGVLSREAIAARVVGLLLRGALCVHGGGRGRVHGRQRLWRRGWVGGAGRW